MTRCIYRAQKSNFNLRLIRVAAKPIIYFTTFVGACQPMFLCFRTCGNFARSVKPRTTFQQKLQKTVQSVYEVPITKEHKPQDRLAPQQTQLQDLPSVRLSDQHLPATFLKRVQQVFSKYQQAQLRDIARKFSELMSLRYKENKLNYNRVPMFARIEEQLSPQKRVEKIHLASQQTVLKEIVAQDTLKEDETPIGVEIGYTQNTVLSYLLNRVPRTFATAVRIFSQIRYRYPKFKPESLIDFGSGLSSGSYAFHDIFSADVPKLQIFNVEPNEKMHKLSKFLSQDIDIKHFRALAEMTRQIIQADIVYAGYVLNQIPSENIELYLEALFCKVKVGGFLVVAEYGNPFGSRLIHDVRRWAIEKKKSKIVMPCPHQLNCPLAAEKRWCHFDQPTGVYPRRIFGKLPTDQAVQNEKFSYMVIFKSSEQQDEYTPEKADELLSKYETPLTKEIEKWDRVLFPPLKRGGHVIIDVCSTEGKLQRKISSKSHGKEQYKQARKIRWGDFWRFPKRIPNKFRKETKMGQRLW